MKKGTCDRRGETEAGWDSFVVEATILTPGNNLGHWIQIVSRTRNSSVLLLYFV